jgi:hypothetical protein
MYRGIHDFKKGYQPSSNIVKDEKDGLVTNSHSILARWKSYLSQLFDVHGASDARQTEIHTAEPLVLSLVPLRLRWLLTSKKDINHQVLIKIIKGGGRIIHSEIHKLINSLWKKEELPEEWMESIPVPIHKKGAKRW